MFKLEATAGRLGILESPPPSPDRVAGPDWLLVIATFLLCSFGLVSIFSATHLDPGTGLTSYYYLERQLIGIAAALPVFFLAWRIDYRRVLRHHTVIYVVNLLLLLAVLKLGHHEVKGAQRWIGIGSFRLQPSEFAKVAIIVTLTAYLSTRQTSIRKLSTVLVSLAHIGVPMLVIFRQPDLGTALVILSIWFIMTYVAGARPRHLGIILVCGLTVFSALWMVGGIKQYQKDRLTVFLHAGTDPRGMGYHITQAIDAIGSGKLWGKALFHGTQGQLGYIPEQHTDFIFTVVGEELGFAGSVSLVLLYTLFLWRGCVIAERALEAEGRLLAVGIVSMFFYHVLVNIGMTIGIMPVTGVPLPFMSYGGSSMMVSLGSVGLLHSIRAQQPRLSL